MIYFGVVSRGIELGVAGDSRGGSLLPTQCYIANPCLSRDIERGVWRSVALLCGKLSFLFFHEGPGYSGMPDTYSHLIFFFFHFLFFSLPLEGIAFSILNQDTASIRYILCTGYIFIPPPQTQSPR